MGVSVGVDPVLAHLLTALGLLDSDNHVVGEWFSHPLESIRTCLSDPTQRAALFHLLDDALPPQPHPLAPAGASWHPLLQDNDIGNAFITVAGDIVGIALVAGTDPSQLPGIQVVATLPLVEAAGSDVRAIAAAPDYPLDIAVVASLGAGIGPEVVGIRVSVDTAGNVRARVRLEDETDTGRDIAEMDPTQLDARMMDAVALLVRSVLAEIGDATGMDEDLARALRRVTTHLFGVLGIGDETLPELPVASAVSDPAALRTWLTGILADQARLAAWFGHCAGLLGAAPLDQANPTIGGTGSLDDPLRATLLQFDIDVDADAALELTLATDGDRLTVGANVAASAGRGRLTAGVGLLSVSIAGTGPVTALPAAQVLLSVPVSADGEDLGMIVAGARWDGTAVVPTLRLDEVVIAGTSYTLDLSSAQAVLDTGADLVAGVLSEAIGEDGAGQHALALLGLVAPLDPGGSPVAGWPRLEAAQLLSGDILRAVAQMHRAVLDDPALSWGALLGQLAGLLGLPTDVAGSGTPAQPWAVTLASDGPLSLDLLAWDERDASTPAGTRLLRLGLRGSAADGVWRASWTAELVGFDLPSDAAGTARFLGSQRLAVALTNPPQVGDDDGPWASVGSVEASVRWRPGSDPVLVASVSDLVLGLGPDHLPPIDLVLPPPSGRLDLTAPDLGLGLGPDLVPAVVRTQLTTALRAWGDDVTAYAVGGLLGLHHELAGLPTGWPSLLPTDSAGFAAALADPLGTVADLLRRIATGTTPDGEPLLAAAVPWIAGLITGAVPVTPGAIPPPAIATGGSGSYEDPWTVPVLAEAEAGSGGPALLLWCDPAPATATLAAAELLRRARNGDDLVAGLAAWPGTGAGVPAVAELLTGRQLTWLGAGIDRLAELLAAGDGLVPFDAATDLPGASWTAAAAVPCGHPDLLSHPQVVTAVTQRVSQWGGGPVVLLSPATGGRRDWAALVSALDPGHDPDASVDLRAAAGTTAQRLAAVTAVALAYPVDLDDDGSGDVAGLADQVDEVIDRIRTLTGASRVTLVGHGIAGLAARAAAERRPAMVRGVVTVGTPNAAPADQADPADLADSAPTTGGVAAAVTDPDLADAARFGAALLGAYPPSAGTPADGVATAAVVDFLSRVLDGGPVRDGALPPPAAFTATGMGAPPDGLTAAVPGLAIGGRLAAGLVQLLASGVQPEPPTEPVAHLGIGVQLAVPLPEPEPDEVHADLLLRADVTRIRLRAGATAPDRPAQRLTARARLWRRPTGLGGSFGGWLAGDDGTDPTDRARVRARWAELGVWLDREPGGLVTRPFAVLHEAGVVGGRAGRVDLTALLSALAVRGARVPLPAGLDGPAMAVVLDVLRALDLVVTDGGTDAVDTAALAALAAGPAGVLGPRAGAVLDVLAAAAGADHDTDTGVWTLPIAEALELQVAPAPWVIRLQAATDDGATDDGDAAITKLVGDLAVTLPGFATEATVALVLGPARLAWRAGTRSLELSLPPWLPPLSLLPQGLDTAAGSGATGTAATGTAAASAAVLHAIPRALLSGLLTPFLSEVFGRRLAAAPIEDLLTHPLRWVQPFDAPAVDAMLAAIGAALDRPTTGGLALPGGLSVRATGPPGGPVDIRLSGTLDVATGTSLGLTAGLRIALTTDSDGIPTAVAVSPLGGATVDATLPGSWEGLRVDVGADAAGLTMGVTPIAGQSPGQRIELIPHFSGLGALAAAAEKLLPAVLQQLVEELSPATGEPTGLLAAALDVAEGLGIYGPDAEGFTRADRAQRLADMLDPTWWEQLVSDPPAVAGAVGGVLAALPLPLGTVATAGGTITWQVPLPDGGDIELALGWATDSRPVLQLSASDVVLGPLVLDEAGLGFDGDLACHLMLHLDAGGLLSPVRPALDVDVTGIDIDGVGPTAPRFAVSILPLGPGTADELDLRLAPVPQIVDGGDAGLALLQAWGVPLTIAVLVAAFDAAEGDLLDTPLWGPPNTTAPGPTARELLAAAGVLTSETAGSAPELANPLPDPAVAALRGLQRAADNVGIELVDTVDAQLTLSLVSQTVPGGVRTGVRLRGWVAIDADDLTVTVRFGDAVWLDDSNGGVTVWLVEPDDAGPLPVRPTAALEIVGFGADLARPSEPLVNGTLVLGSLGALVFATVDFFDSTNAPEVTVTELGAGLAVTDTFVNVAGEDADSFLRKVMPAELTAPFDLTVVYRDGELEVHGATPAAPGRYELSLPLDLDLTIIRISELMLALQTGAAPALEAALSGTAAVGPIAATVKRVGIIAVFGGDRPGLRFRFPDGVGLSIDTSSLRLGGFVLVDEARGRYIGAVEIALFGKFELAAIAIITTKMPDGSPGFSLLFLISIIFPMPIPLGYGYFFAGAGGLLGLNRSVDLDRLRIGLRAGTADSILFPTDIVRRADAIVRDLEESFPISRGMFLLGPMAMITWSTPPLVSLKLGIILQLGTPFRIAILGVLRAALPDPKEAVLDLKVAFLGTIDIGAQLLTFDAAIYDSFIGREDFKLELEGDIAVRLSWSDQPDFVTSVGGFHPRYTPASHLKLPPMRRLRISLLKDNPRLSMSTYFAITANSVQFGARLDFYLGVSGFSVEGEFGLDVLFQFSPFLFDAAVYARLAVKAGGSVLLAINLDFTLVGPTPWVARGTASFKVLFFTVRAEFEKRFGEEALDSTPLIALLPVITTELERAENWQGLLPTGTVSAVSLLPLDVPDGHVLVEAGGALSFSQRVLPLGTPVTRFGTSKPSDVSAVGVPSIFIGQRTQPEPAEPLTERFSPAAFREMSDADKLQAPAFERRPAGVAVQAGAGLRATYTRPRPARYDLIVCDSGDPADEVATRGHEVPEGRFVAQVRGGAAGRSAAARERRRATEGRVLDAAAPADLYAVVRVGDLRALDPAGAATEPTGAGPDGLPEWPPDVLLQRSDADRRLAELARSEPASALRVLPAAQLTSQEPG
ncbi:MAG: hypothetical protein L0Y54_17230 [Sporichthyaceae bacterium]|nr:hypothetical protein [Sporichthyaceae bacterium]